MDFKTFLQNQERIYQKFRNQNNLLERGIVSNLPHERGGYLVALRHPKSITEQIEKFSKKVIKQTGSIPYGPLNAHTTLFDYGLSNEFSPNTKTLKRLGELIKQNLPPGQIKLIYTSWLMNQNSGIATGIPNPAFLHTAQNLVLEGTKKGIPLRLPWGGHITIARFQEPQKDLELENLISLFKEEPPLGESEPFAIDIGYFRLTPSEFEYHTSERVLI